MVRVAQSQADLDSRKRRDSRKEYQVDHLPEQAKTIVDFMTPIRPAMFDGQLQIHFNE